MKKETLHKVLMGIGVLLPIFILLWYFLPLQRQGDLSLHGNVDIRQVELGFRLNGRIAEMRVEEGTAVKAGDMLASLDKTSFMHERDIAKAQAEQATADLAKMEKGSRISEIEQARATVKEREAAYDNANRFLERQANLLKTNSISKQAYEDALTKKKEAEARLKSAQEALKLSEEGFRAEDIASARAALSAANAKLANAENNLKDTELTAPNDGIILTRVREPGAIVASGATVYTLTLHNPVWVRSYVSEKDLGHVKPGMEALVFTDTDPNKPLKGQVGFISPQAEFTPKNIESKELRPDLVYRLRITVEDSDGRLRQGMPVTVSLKAVK